MKMTLLDIVRNIMAALNEDEIDSIADTPTALDVAEIVREAYYQILSLKEWSHLKTGFQLTPSQDTSKPTVMYVPEDVSNIDWVKYKDDNGKFLGLTYMEPEQFVTMMDDRTNSDSKVLKFTHSGISFKVYNNKKPSFWTTLDGNTIYFDSVDLSYQSTLEQSDTSCFGHRIPDWSAVDDFIPDLQAESFPYLLAEAKSIAFLVIGNIANSKAEQYARRGRFRSRYAEGNFKTVRPTPDYGRK